MGDVTVDADGFASAICKIVDRLDEGVVNGIPKATRHAVNVGRKAARENAAGHGWSKEYSGGFSGHVGGSGRQVTGEVGNRSKPGLVHLLEKGHNTLTGRRTAAYPHMKPALGDMEDDFERQVDEMVDKAIGGA